MKWGNTFRCKIRFHQPLTLIIQSIQVNARKVTWVHPPLSCQWWVVDVSQPESSSWSLCLWNVYPSLSQPRTYTYTVHAHHHPHHHHLILSVFKPWPGSLQSLPPCQRELSSSSPHHQPFSWLLPLLFSDAPPIGRRKRNLYHTTSHMICACTNTKMTGWKIRIFMCQWGWVVLPRSCFVCPSPSLSEPSGSRLSLRAVAPERSGQEIVNR